VRTWDDNKSAINQLWPRAEFTDEERRLWHDDLSTLDQVVLYDAIRNVKRNNDTLYPQLKWFREEYRHLERLRRFHDARKVKGSDQPRETVDIDPASDAKVAADLRDVIEMLTPSQWQEGIDLIKAKAGENKLALGTACKLGRYLNERLGMNQGGSIS
jgi:hypothetical protein